MIYPYIVKYLGKYYEAGTEVPVINTNTVMSDTKEKNKEKEKEKEESFFNFDSTIDSSIPTKTDIQRMKKSELIRKSEELGYTVDGMNGEELKKLLTNHYNL